MTSMAQRGPVDRERRRSPVAGRRSAALPGAPRRGQHGPRRRGCARRRLGSWPCRTGHQSGLRPPTTGQPRTTPTTSGSYSVTRVATNPGGALHLLLEVIAYADDEAREQGRTGDCHVTLFADGSVRVDDDGRGTDTRPGPYGEPVRKPIMSTEDVRFFDVDPQVLLPDGLPRHGISVVSALSEWLHHRNRRSDGAWEQRYEHGRPCNQLAEVRRPATRTGTTVTYRLDTALVPVSGLTSDLVRGAARFPSLIVRCTTEARSDELQASPSSDSGRRIVVDNRSPFEIRRG